MISDTDCSSVESLMQALHDVERDRDNLRLENESLKVELQTLSSTLQKELKCTKNLVDTLVQLQQDKHDIQEKLSRILEADSTKRGIRFMQLHSEGQEFFKAHIDLTGKILMHIADKCTREGWFADTLQEVADDLNDNKGNISRSMKKLIDGVNPPLRRIKTGRGYVYALNPNYIWHGKVDTMFTTSAYSICKRIETGEIDRTRVIVALRAYKDDNNVSGLKGIRQGLVVDKNTLN